MDSKQEQASRVNALHPGRIIVGILVIAAIWASYPFWLGEFLRLIHWTGPDHAAATGQFGDSFGALNTLFSGLAFAVLIVTLLLQRHEMEEQRREFRRNRDIAERQETALRRQTFEATLFQWLGLHHQLVDRINFEFTRTHYQAGRPHFEHDAANGRNALAKIWQSRIRRRLVAQITELSQKREHIPDLLTAVYDAINALEAGNEPAGDIQGVLGTATPDDTTFVVQMFREVYEETYYEYEHQFDHYLRSVFRLFRWILLSEWPTELKREYVGIVRAQISWVELAFLLLNCLTPAGQKMRRIAEITAMFDNYGRTDDPIYRVIRASGAIGDSAFATDAARQEFDDEIDGPNLNSAALFGEA